MLVKKYSFIGLFFLLSACSHDDSQTFQGYMEGEYLYMAPSVSGHLDILHVQRGEMIKANQSLFVLEQTDELAKLQAQQAQLKKEQATLQDMLTGERPSEVESIQAQISQAESVEKLANIDFRRDQKQYKIGAITQAQLDKSRTEYNVSKEQVIKLQSDLATANLPSREEQIKAQTALVAYAKANVKDAQWALEQTVTQAEQASLVFDTLYNKGEWVASGNPVVVLLPPENLKIRFFIPETALSSVHIGQRVDVACDGCKKPIEAKISYISDKAEYTPPVIYSNETRSQLIFKIEAKPESPDLLTMHPGQPVEVIVHGD
jgi:HlyD family secretion protein